MKKTAHEGEVVYFSQNFFQPVRLVRHPVGLKSHVVIQSWQGHLWAYVDGAPVVTDYIPEWKMARGSDERSASAPTSTTTRSWCAIAT